MLITPIIAIFMGLFFKLIAMYSRKSDKKHNHKNLAARNKKAWFLSQRMGGLSFVIAGIITVIGCIFFFLKLATLIFANVCRVISMTWGIIYSRIAYKKSIVE